ncbi:hypothetical protein PAXINDRAFT_103008 [Paxillus involutus ATCC 200175]|uniref:Uncharacterized protein n=1 Tax=Paxillus involutus ATCC 200175 TaxID=664439 RepID=A0A0C9TH52_PAXIN|nr:hypothetical protein PAXINDRAFT_103008 [Paxillus involutus ATCC 200175]
MRLSGESPDAEPRSSETSAGNSQIRNQPESIEMIAIPETSTVSAHASPQLTPSTDRSSSAIPSCEPSSSTPNVISAPLIVSSPEERAFIQEYRRRKDKPVILSGPARDRDSYVHLEPSTPLPPSSGSVTPCPSLTPLLISPQARFHIRAGPSPIHRTTLALLSPSSLSAASRHSHSCHQPSTTGDAQSLDQTASVGNTVVEGRDTIKTVSPGSPAADEADRQRDILHLQEKNEQLRRQLDDAVAAMRKAEAAREGLATGSPGAGPSTTQDGPSGGSKLITDIQVEHSAFSNVPSQGHPPSPTQFISDSIEAEEQANEKRKENTFSDQTNKATDSQHRVHPSHHHDPTKNDITMASPASTAADVANLQRGLLQMQEQLDQLRRRFDDPTRKGVAERDGLDTAVEAGPSSRN